MTNMREIGNKLVIIRTAEKGKFCSPRRLSMKRRKQVVAESRGTLGKRLYKEIIETLLRGRWKKEAS